ncbi:MAG: hypothetical protein KDD89_04345 [Anaerolineales bacterium]|nr:hypothetical protein [Anaerolineales bacterium]
MITEMETEMGGLARITKRLDCGVLVSSTGVLWEVVDGVLYQLRWLGGDQYIKLDGTVLNIVHERVIEP